MRSKRVERPLSRHLSPPDIEEVGFVPVLDQRGNSENSQSLSSKMQSVAKVEEADIIEVLRAPEDQKERRGEKGKSKRLVGPLVQNDGKLIRPASRGSSQATTISLGNDGALSDFTSAKRRNSNSGLINEVHSQMAPPEVNTTTITNFAVPNLHSSQALMQATSNGGDFPRSFPEGRNIIINTNVFTSSSPATPDVTRSQTPHDVFSIPQCNTCQCSRRKMIDQETQCSILDAQSPLRPKMASIGIMTEAPEPQIVNLVSSGDSSVAARKQTTTDLSKKTFMESEDGEADQTIDFFDALLPSSDDEPEDDHPGIRNVTDEMTYDTAVIDSTGFGEKVQSGQQNNEKGSDANEDNCSENGDLEGTDFAPFRVNKELFPCEIAETRSLATHDMSNYISIKPTTPVKDVIKMLSETRTRQEAMELSVDKVARTMCNEPSDPKPSTSNEPVSTPKRMNNKELRERISQPVIMSPRIDYESLDDHAKGSFISCSQKSNASSSSISRPIRSATKRHRARIMSSSSNDENSDGEKLSELKRKRCERNSPAAIDYKRKKHSRVDDSREGSDTEFDMRLVKPLKFTSKKRISLDSNVEGDDDGSPQNKSKLSAFAMTGDSLISDESEGNTVPSQSIFKACKSPASSSKKKSATAPNLDEFFEDDNEPLGHRTWSKKLICSDDSTTEDDDVPLDEIGDRCTLEELTLNKPLKEFKKVKRGKRNSKPPDKNVEAGVQRSPSPASTVTLSSGGESDDNDRSQVKIVRLPEALKRSTMLLNNDPTVSGGSRQTKLNFPAAVKSEGLSFKRQGIPNVKKHYTSKVTKYENSENDSYDDSSSSDDEELEMLLRTSASRSSKSTSSSVASKSKTTSTKSKTNNKIKDYKGKQTKRNKSGSESDESLSDSDAELARRQKRRRALQENRKQRFRKQAAMADDEVAEVLSQESRRSFRKSNHILTDAELNKQTRKACKEEKDRVARLNRRDQRWTHEFEIVEDAKVYTKVWLEKITKDGVDEPLVEVQPIVASKLKEHQIEGVQFLYNCTVESVQRSLKSEGTGCILAHCMGLGKTFQVIAFLDAVLTSQNLDHFQRAIIIAPCSTLFNWKKEFSKWLGKGKSKSFEVLNIDNYKKESKEKQIRKLEHWSEAPGVLIVGYEMFTNLVKSSVDESSDDSKTNNAPKPKSKKSLNLTAEQKRLIHRILVDPGADFVICDEGHELKNEKTAKSIHINMVKTQRRISLTGTPLQNNLKEYYVMGNFVKPYLLGNKKEFSNRFTTPITKGQKSNALPYEVKLMQKRTHVLHKQLSECVHRRDFSYIKQLLPSKFEYTVEIKLGDLQVEMYRKFLKMYVLAGTQENPEVDDIEEYQITKNAVRNMFRNKNMLTKIICHPIATTRSLCKKDEFETNAEGAKENPKPQDIEDELGTMADIFERSLAEAGKADENTEESSEPNAKEWRGYLETVLADQLTPGAIFDIEQSGKFLLLCEIVKRSNALGDKVLVFSQSLVVLDLIEEMFAMFVKAQREKWNKEECGVNGLEAGDCKWTKGVNYLRLDGSTPTDERKRRCKDFNNPENNFKLMIISTRAGSLGINLHAANRVIVFDASWNPTHDIQAMFRVYRMGQQKQTFVYRFIGQGTIEQKVYYRQILKVSLAERVVDKNSKERHFTDDDIGELYRFNPSSEESPLQGVPEDGVLADLVYKHKDKWIGNFYQHDSLLKDDDNEDLTENEKLAAWEEYEKERERMRSPPPQGIPPANLIPNLPHLLPLSGLNPAQIPPNVAPGQVPTFSDAPESMVSNFSSFMSGLFSRGATAPNINSTTIPLPIDLSLGFSNNSVIRPNPTSSNPMVPAVSAISSLAGTAASTTQNMRGAPLSRSNSPEISEVRSLTEEELANRTSTGRQANSSSSAPSSNSDKAQQNKQANKLSTSSSNSSVKNPVNVPPPNRDLSSKSNVSSEPSEAVKLVTLPQRATHSIATKTDIQRVETVIKSQVFQAKKQEMSVFEINQLLVKYMDENRDKIRYKEDLIRYKRDAMPYVDKFRKSANNTK